MIRLKQTFFLITLILLISTSSFAQKGETVKIAWIDPLSGLMAPVGSNGLKSFKFIAEEFNSLTTLLFFLHGTESDKSCIISR